MPLRDIAAVTRQQRRLGDQRIVEQVDQCLVAGQVARGTCQNRRSIAADPFGNDAGRRQARADRGKIARTAAVEREA